MNFIKIGDNNANYQKKPSYVKFNFHKFKGLTEPMDMSGGNLQSIIKKVENENK